MQRRKSAPVGWRGDKPAASFSSPGGEKEKSKDCVLGVGDFGATATTTVQTTVPEAELAEEAKPAVERKPEEPPAVAVPPLAAFNQTSAAPCRRPPTTTAQQAAEEGDSHGYVGRHSFVEWLSFNLAHFIELWGGDDFSRRGVRGGASLSSEFEALPSLQGNSLSLQVDRPHSSSGRVGAGMERPSSSVGAVAIGEECKTGGATLNFPEETAEKTGRRGFMLTETALGSAISSKEFFEETHSAESGHCESVPRPMRRVAGESQMHFNRRRARNPLRFASRTDEEAYRRYLNGLYPFRLLVVGILMLFVDLLQIIWIFVLEGSPSSVPFSSSLRINPSVFRCVIASFASHVLLYALLAVAAKIPVLSRRLEATSLSLLSLAFLSRVICLCIVASLTSSEHRSGCAKCGQLFPEAVSEGLDPLPGEYLAYEVAEHDATFRSAATETVTSELLLLSTAALFHTLIVDVMLPVRTMKSLFVHMLYIVSCAGVVIYCALLYGKCLPYMGPVCVVSSCIFLLCGLLGRVQSELAHRQLYDRWRRSTRLLRESERQLRSQHGAQTGIEKLAFLVRRSVAILRSMGSLTQRDFASAQLQIDQVATLQSQVLEIVTDVHNVYHARISKEQLQDVVRFIPEILDAPASLREPGEASDGSASPSLSYRFSVAIPDSPPHPCEEATSVDEQSDEGPSAAAAILDCPLPDLKTLLENVGGNAEAEAMARLVGVEWDLDILQLDAVTNGNSLLLVGQSVLLPLRQREGLQSSTSQILGFVQCMQQQYCNSNTYHNAIHAAMVVHCCKVLSSGIACNGAGLTILEEVALMVASLAHDVGHPGLTNQYLINVRSPLAITYNDISVLENYHASCCFRTAAAREFNVFHGLTKECFQCLRQHIIELILATDMKLHFDVISHLRVRKGTPNFNICSSPQDRWIFFKACIKASDLAHAAMPWAQHRLWSERLAEEFYRQGDAEKRQGLPVSNLCDRQLRKEFSRSQADFIKVVVTPLFVEISEVVRRQPSHTTEVSSRIDKNINGNIEQWKLLHEQERQRDQGEAEPSHSSDTPKPQRPT